MSRAKLTQNLQSTLSSASWARTVSQGYCDLQRGWEIEEFYWFATPHKAGFPEEYLRQTIRNCLLIICPNQEWDNM